MRRCRKIASDGAEVRCVGRLFHRLAAETGKARLPTVVRLNDGTISCSDADDRNLDRERLSIETIPLSGLVSEIFSPKVPTMIIRDDVISNVIRPGSTIREDHIDRPYSGTLCSSIAQF